ncbi:MAG: alginate export family protein [Ferrovibrio sp.]|uniref:alginate export family protein n=1 Tax=Ferrovibrio sp. TaxID=1917215 RepID=UPI00391893C5
MPRRLLFVPALLAACGMGLPALADDDGHEARGLTRSFGDLDLTLTLDAGFGLFSVTNAIHGLGSQARGSNTREGGRAWSEGFIAPGLTADWNLGDSSLYGGFKLVGSATRGEGDAQRESSTSDRPESLGIEDAYLGWKSGIAFASLGEDAVDVSVGRQPFSVGDGFLLMDGTAEGFRRAAYVLGPRSSFDRTAIVKFNTEPVRADIFHLEGNVDQRLMTGSDAAATRLYGGNIEWFASSHKDHGRFEYDERLWYVGATALTVYEADRGVASNRDGLDVYALRAGGALLSGLGEGWQDFAFYSEIGLQRNGDASRKSRAHAWYAEPQYTFSALPWTPRLSYRYAHFSGDADANDGRNTAWDALYTGGGPRGFGTWDLGEIYARYTPNGNSNLNSHMVHLRLQPMEELAVGGLVYRHFFDKPDTANGVRSDDLLTEVNVYAEWETPVRGLSVTGILGAAKAGDGRRQQLGTTDATDRTTYLGEVVFGYSF